MELINVALTRLIAAPWRFSEDRNLGISQYEQATPIQDNILTSLQAVGQIAPIHVRPLENGDFEIVDGHIVVDAARQAKLESLAAIVHPIGPGAAREMYIYLNLNRCGQYGHRHVKIMREFKATAKPAEELFKLVAFEQSRVEDYLAISERDDSWRKFMFATDNVGELMAPIAGFEEDSVVVDN